MKAKLKKIKSDIVELNIYEFTKMSIENAYAFVCDLFLELSDYQMEIAKQILENIFE